MPARNHSFAIRSQAVPAHAVIPAKAGIQRSRIPQPARPLGAPKEAAC